MAVPAVRYTPEFDRVAALPWRVIDAGDAAAWAEVFTRALRAPGSKATVRRWQGLGCAEALDNDGAFLAYPVGTGKTWISYALPTLFEASRPMLICPASLRDKSWADFASYRGQWRAPRHPIRIVSREELALDQNRTLLQQYRPDLIIIDEADDLANPASSACRRLDRYRIETWDDPDVRYVAMTGTPGRNSLLNYWHLLIWCLRDNAPLPLIHAEAVMWAMVLDHKPRNPRRPHPGPLGATRDEAVEWFARRLRETPGVVIVDEDSCDAPLEIRTRLAREDPILDAAFDKFLHTFENPGGIVVGDPLSRWLLDGQMGCGLFTVFDPPPPDEWRIAYRAKAKFVRDAIDNTAHAREPLDTEMQVLRKYAEHPIVQAWRAVKPTFVANTKAIWITTSTIESARDWLAESDTPGIVWCGSVDFGRALAHATRLAYYGRKGQCEGGGGLHEAPEGRSMVASWAANKKGFNLQAWPRQLIVMPPQSAKWLEQIFGRSHRSGQAQRVTIDILLTSGGTIDAFEAALGEARHNKNSWSLTQKILRANLRRATPRLTKSNQYRWATRSKGQ